MKMNNKKGFTLIELLAVIVILAIIALIAVPIVVNIMEKSKEESYKRSVEFAIDAAELYLVENGLSEIPEAGINVTDLKLKNNNFKSGVIKENNEEEVIAEKVSNGEYCASGEKGSIKVSKGSCDGTVESLEIYNVTTNSVTSSSITVVVDINNKDNIKGYYYAKDEEDYGNIENTNTHIFTGLTKNTSYTIKVKVEDNEGTIAEKEITVKTIDISAPTYTQIEEENKITVTITYPSEKEENWIYEYQQYTSEIGDSWTEVKETTAIVEFTSNGKLVARVRDTGNSNNTVEASTYEVTNIVYKEELLKGSDPKIIGDLIPVKIADDGTVTKADISTKWYNYENQEWANAVILNEGVDSSKYNDCKTEIPEEKIKGYFVWIPRYKYQIFNDTLYESLTKIEKREQEIKIEFQEIDDTIEKGETNGQWLTHPAFTSLEVSGIWVGKFEVGYNQNSTTSGDIETNDWTTSGAEKTESYTTDLPTKIIVKPNVYSWRSQVVHTFFKTLYNFDTSLNSHMMKNTEWGAVAYLSHSKYGKYGNSKYTGEEGLEKEVYINNCSNYTTGIAGDTVSASETSDCKNTYKTEQGQKASTTGNITGIYDMSGGASEYVAGYVQDGTMVYSEFDKDPIEQYSDIENVKNYFDVYDKNSTYDNYTTRILGDATGEMGPFEKTNANYNTYYTSSWYGDYADFVYYRYPWFKRGGYSNGRSNAGVFSFFTTNGNYGSSTSSRLVLSPSN